MTALSWGAQEQRCSFEARRTCSLSPTKGKIDLAESRGNFLKRGKEEKKKKHGRKTVNWSRQWFLATDRSRSKRISLKTERCSGNYSCIFTSFTQPQLQNSSNLWKCCIEKIYESNILLVIPMSLPSRGIPRFFLFFKFFFFEHVEDCVWGGEGYQISPLSWLTSSSL